MALMPLAIASIVADFLRNRFGIEAGIKWPNDVLAGGRKIAGENANKLVNDQNAVALFGFASSTLSLDAMPIVKKLHLLPLLYLGRTPVDRVAHRLRP